MTKFRLRNYMNIFTLGWLCLSLLCCQPELRKDSTEGLSAENDSIQSWIERSKNKVISSEEQANWLEKALELAKQQPEDSLKSEYFSQISLQYLRRKDSLRFRRTSKETVALALRVGDSINLAEAQWDLGTFFNNYSIPDSAYYYYGEAHQIFNALNDPLYSGRMLQNMARIQADIKDYIGSEINTIKAIRLLKSIDAIPYLYYCYNNMGVVSKELGEYDRAIEYYDQAILIAQQFDTTNTRVYGLLNNKGNVYQRQGLHRKAIDLYEEAMGRENLLVENPHNYAQTLGNLALSRLMMGDLEGVENQLNTSLEIRDSINDIEGLALVHHSLAEYYLVKKDTARSKLYAKHSLEFAKQSDNNKRILLTYQLLSKNDPENAAYYADAYIALNDSLQMQERKIRDKFARIEFETDEFIEENRLLARQRQLWIGIATGVLLLAIAIFIIINQRTRNQKLRFEQQQQEANQEIFDLMLSTSQKVEEGKHDEQKRISEELHDGVLGQMNGIRMVLLGLNKKNDDNSVSMRSEAIEKLQNVQEEIRTISHELSDAAYQKFHNFIISIRDLVNSISQASEIACEFNYDHDADWDDLSGEIKINLYRIVQEGLQNCVKYSHANLIKLNFGANESELTIRLEDDGVGFDTKKAKKGIGHKNINSRLQKIGGSWQLESAPGKGTKITIKVPYVRSSQHKAPEEDHVLEKETLE